MARVNAWPASPCPLKDSRPAAMDWTTFGIERRRFLIWRDPGGWVVAHGLTGAYTILLWGLPCWHLAAQAIPQLRRIPSGGEFGRPGYKPGGWTTPTLPATHDCYFAPTHWSPD